MAQSHDVVAEPRRMDGDPAGVSGPRALAASDEFVAAVGPAEPAVVAS